MALRKNKWFPDNSPGTIQKDGFVNIKNLLAYLCVDMRMLGFTLICFARGKHADGQFNTIDPQAQSESINNSIGVCDTIPPDPQNFLLPNHNVTDNEITYVMFESNEYVDNMSWTGDPCDPCHPVEGQRYRVLFVIPELSPNKMQLIVASPNLLTYTKVGEACNWVAYLNPATAPNYAMAKYAGEIAITNATAFFDPSANWGVPISTTATDPFRAYPLSYRICVSDHGFFFSIWAQTPDKNAEMKSCWFMVQRNVSPSTGLPTKTGRCPLFCLFSCDGKIVYKTVIREQDVLVPSKYLRASEHYTDSTAIINIQKQTVITENNQYVVTFPNGLNTDRYCYVEELDLLGYTSADVIGHYGIAEFSMYNEVNDLGDIEGLRKYMALHANGAYATGMRVLMQVEGPGVTVERRLVEETPNSIIYID